MRSTWISGCFLLLFTTTAFGADLTREQMIEYVTTVAQENPDSIAKLVKLWLAE